MHWTYDSEANAVYIDLTDQDLLPGRDSIPCETPEGVQAMVVLDWKDGRLVGVEVLDARELLHSDFIAAAEHIA